MGTLELILIVIAGIVICIPIEYSRRKYIKQKIKEGTEERLKGNDYKVKYPFRYGHPTDHLTYYEIKNGIDKNVEEINKSNNIQEPKQ